MNNSGTKLLSGALLALLFVLGLVLFSPNRSVSRLMESCGDYISQAFGL